ncbi:MAG: energy-coupling factor transporter transmembrane protein EcfT [Firmicutes bacterium]|nr:energy-coupling factor transporter transmembrane protein EcfT [Bacillota bacterium]
MRDVTLGQYYPGESFVHRLDARVKLIATVAYIVMLFFIKTVTVYLGVAALLFIIVLLTGIPVKMVLKSIRAILFLIIFTMLLNLFLTPASAGNEYALDLYFYRANVTDVIFTWWRFIFSFTGIEYALKMAMRLLLLVMGPSLLTLTTTPVTLTDAIESLLKPLKAIRFPVHEFAMIMSIALRLIPTIMEETDKIILAQKARCAEFDSGNLFKKARALLPVLIPLFVSSLRRAEDLADAMDSRCYKGSKGRTKLKQFRLRFADFAGLFAVALVFFAVLCIRYNYFNLEFVNMIV